MIDLVYKVLQTIVNKEQSGYVSPDEFNKIAHLTQEEIFRNYFEDFNRDQVKENRGLISQGLGNLPQKEAQRINMFSKYMELDVTVDNTAGFDTATLPEDLYYLEDRAMMTGSGKVVEEVSMSSFGYVKNSISAFSKLYPVYARQGNELKLYPQGLTLPISANYIRKPKQPRWTYREINGEPLFDPSSNSFQDFELHSSEFSNIVLKMLTHFGISLREAQVIEITERLKNTVIQKDNS